MLPIVALIVVFLLKSRASAIYYTALLVAFLFVMSVGKIAYHSPRPYMVDSDIKVFDCSTEYGNPSGHAMSASSLLLTVFLDHFFSDSSSNNSNIFVTLAALAGNIGSIFLVDYSRLYLGVHSLD